MTTLLLNSAFSLQLQKLPRDRDQDVHIAIGQYHIYAVMERADSIANNLRVNGDDQSKCIKVYKNKNRVVGMNTIDIEVNPPDIYPFLQ